jgi:D-beta-D-heptose 7-phosphate kinase/D-beta-D-heptose 1-phosphate adenosyltransferase
MISGLKVKYRIESFLKRFKHVKILVVGDIMMDRFIWGRVSRISPEAPVPVVLFEKEEFLLGGAANVVNNIYCLGGKGSICGVVGDDEMGMKIIQKMNEIGIETSGIFIEKGRQTTVKTRIVAHQQQVVRIDRETTNSPSSSILPEILEFLNKSIEDFNGIILSDYGKGLLNKELIRKIVKKAKENRRFIIVDPKVKNFFFYKGVTVITPNTNEASEASGISIVDEDSLKKAGKKLLNRLGCESLVITRGEEGMAIFEPHKEPFLVPTKAREVFDVTGAGDTVVGTMALALGAGASIKTAVELANYAAGVVVGKVGTATLNQQELIDAIRNG